MSPGATDLLGYMHERACFRDHIYFAADSTAAGALGVSRMTIQRRKRELERNGVVTRIEHPKFKRTVCYRMRRVTQRSYGAKKPLRTPSTVPFGHSAGRVSVCGRRRRLMERHLELLTDGVMRKTGAVTPFNAGDSLAAALDMYGEPVPRSIRARLGKAAKELLADGFDPQTISNALYTAILRARPDLASTIALEIQNARGGKHLGWKEYQRELASLNQASRPGLDVLRQGLREAFK